MQLPRSRYRSLAGGTLLFAFVSFGAAALCADDNGASLTLDQKEEFLRKAKIGKVQGAKKGVTNTSRATLSDGTVTHDASIQKINESKPVYQASDGSSEVNFKDSYRYNIAAWKLARVLGIDDMLAPSVERKYNGDSAAFTWWIDDVIMDEVQRKAKKMQAPDPDHWNSEMYVVRVFDQLIYNTDRNLTNLLIDKDWRIWMIDHTRAFRLQHTLKDVRDLVQCDRKLLAKLKELDEPTLQKQLMPYANKEEIKGLLARRDLIVKFFAEKGDSVLYDRPPRT
jgi:hypothetical protein